MFKDRKEAGFGAIAKMVEFILLVVPWLLLW